MSVCLVCINYGYLYFTTSGLWNKPSGALENETHACFVVEQWLVRPTTVEEGMVVIRDTARGADLIGTGVFHNTTPLRAPTDLEKCDCISDHVFYIVVSISAKTPGNPIANANAPPLTSISCTPRICNQPRLFSLSWTNDSSRTPLWFQKYPMYM